MLKDALANDRKNISRSEAFLNILKLGLPMAASYTFSFSIIAIGILTGHMNDEHHEDTLAATTLITTMTDTLVLLALSSLFSISILTSHERGQLLKLEQNSFKDASQEMDKIQQRQRVSRLLKNGLILATVTIPPPLLLMNFSETILIRFGQNKEIARIVQIYSRSYMWAIPAIVIRFCFEQIMLAFEKQNPAMILGLINFTIGTLLSGLLCFGYGPFPQLGLPGIAYGFLTEAYLTFLSYGFYLGCSPEFKNFNFFRNFKFDREDRQQLIALTKIGLPITLTLVNEIAASFTINILAGLLGKDELTAQDFSSQLSFITLIPLAALGQASCQEVSRAIGKENYHAASRTARYGLLASLSVIGFICIPVAVYPNIITSVITDSRGLNDHVFSITKTLVPITAAGVLFDSARYNLLQVLRGAKDHIIPTVISVSNGWLGVLLAYILGFHTDLGIYGLGIGYTIGLATGAISLLSRWYSRVTPEALERTNRPSPNDASSDSCWSRFFSKIKLGSDNLYNTTINSVVEDNEKIPLLKNMSVIRES